jgi:hypothetical protein
MVNRSRFRANRIITLNEGKGFFVPFSTLEKAAVLQAVESEDKNAEEDRLQLISS